MDTTTFIRLKTSVLNVIVGIFLITSFCAPQSVAQAGEDGYKGWEKGSQYNSLFNNKERDQLKGIIVKFITVSPLSGMSEGTALLLDEGDGDKIEVHLCPLEYATARATGLRKGSKVKIKGSWAIIDDEDIFLAAKVKQGENYQFKVRLSSDGTPFWTLSPEELAKETNQ